MDCYIIRDKDPQGGVYEVWRVMPELDVMRNTVQEIRKGTFPAETWMLINFAEIKPDPINHYDELIIPHWEVAEPYWSRKEGFVDGAE